MPKENQGYFTVELELPEGATIERTREVTRRALNFLMQDPDVDHVLDVVGSSPRVGIYIFGLENNVYFQIGLVMLIGLVAKNAILIVEFAKVEMDKGVDAMSAALTAARLRFRPIVMTSLAFILGLLPVVLSSGPGSASRQGIGTGVFFGMCVAITIGIVYVPFFFVWIDRIKRKSR